MGQFIYGKNAVLEALEAKRVEKVWLSTSFQDSTLLALIGRLRLPVERTSEHRLQTLCKGLHQGIVAEVKSFQYTSLDQLLDQLKGNPQPLLVFLDEVQDPQNFGAIIRNAVGLFADAIIVKKMHQVDVTAVVAKVASGALEHLPIVHVANLSQAMDILKPLGYWFAATSLATTTIDYRQFNYRGPVGLIFGSEGHGVSPLVAKNADSLIKIPLSPQLESFNVASSVAIVLAEAYRQRFPL